MQKIVYGVLARVFAVVLVLVGIGAVFGGNFAHGYVTDQLSQGRGIRDALGGWHRCP